MHEEVDPAVSFCRATLRLLAGALVSLCACTGHAQSSTATSPQPAFDVASVKIVDSHPYPIDGLVKGIGLFSASTYPTNRFFAHNASLKTLITLAYGGTNLTVDPAPRLP